MDNVNQGAEALLCLSRLLTPAHGLDPETQESLAFLLQLIAEHIK